MNPLQRIQASTGDFFPRFQSFFAQQFEQKDPVVDETLNHLRHANGKHIRPLIVALSSLLIADRVTDEAVHLAVFMEMLHTSSLIHDDVIDNSDTRRGHPTLNVIYNNHVAVLVGDYLLSTAMLNGLRHASKDTVLLLVEVAQKLALGELSQIKATHRDTIISEEEYFDIIDKKTASLFKVATMIASSTAGANAKQAKSLFVLGETIGMAFQVKDDIFDYFQDRETIGKPTGLDLQEGKVTLPLIYAYGKASEQEKIQIEKWRKEIATDAHAGEALIAITKQLGGIEAACDKLAELLQKARSELTAFEDSKAKQAFEDLLAYLEVREF